MSNGTHEPIHTDAIYTRKRLQEIFGVRDGRAIDAWLEKHGIEVCPGPGGADRDLIRGSAILAGIVGRR